MEARPMKSLSSISWILHAIICIAIVLDLSSLDREGLIWAYVKPVYGLAQQGLFAAWFGWCAVLGSMLFQNSLRRSGAKLGDGRA
jgi:hypothetical protein